MKPALLTLTIPLLLGGAALVFGLVGLMQPDLAGMASWWLMALVFGFFSAFWLVMLAEELPEPQPVPAEEPSPQLDSKDLRIAELAEENARLRAESGYR